MKHESDTPIRRHKCQFFRRAALLLVLLFSAGLSAAVAANLLTNPGFESGQTGWADPNLVRGGSSTVITAPAIAHSGNNCISNYNATGGSGAQQGDANGAYGTGVSIPVSDAKYYKLSAYVKLPGASTNAQDITLRYRFEPSGNRVDVGAKTINTENWTLLESPWVKTGTGDFIMSYWEVHSLNNGVLFYADDCALTESDPFVLNGRVVDGGGAGVDGVTVIASSATSVSPSTVTAGGGYYSISTVPDTGTYTVKASEPGFRGSSTVTVSSSPTTVPNIVLGVDPDYDANLIFSAYSSNLVAGSPWPTACPASASLVPIVSPSVQSFGGVKWGKYDYPSAQGFRFEDSGIVGGAYNPLTPIPINGISIVTAVKPIRNNITGNWNSIVDLFYNEVTFEMRGANGRVGVRLKNYGFVRASTANAVPDGQSTVLSLVVQPDGAFKVWANGSMIISNTPATPIDMTSLFPGGSLANGGGQAYLTYADYMNVGRNNPDTWSAFNGYIGDTFVYKIALSDAARLKLEADLTAKFITGATLSYGITASADSNSSITPSGATNILQGLDKTYTFAANSGYIISDLLVDGVSVPVPASLTYTFTNVSANHTIVAKSQSWPDQTVTASVTGSGGTISPLGATSVVAGTSPTFALLPNDGHRIADVLVDGASVGAVSTYTFSRVIAPHTISASFAAISMNIPRTDQLIFSAVTDSLPGDGSPTGAWPTYVPTGQTLTVIGGAPIVQVTDGVKWEMNNSSAADAFRFKTYSSPIPCSGATIVVAAKPYRGANGLPWDSIVDVFYNRLCMGIMNSDGTVVVKINGVDTHGDAAQAIPEGQSTILCLVVKPDGSWKVWANSAQIMSGSGAAMTSLVPNVPGTYANAINVGRNNPDTWPCFNGNIGDVFVYTTALTDAQRSQMESILMPKFKCPLPPSYKWAGPNNGNWSNPANWSDTLPGFGNVATFSASASAGQTVQLDTDVNVSGLQFNSVAPNTTIASSSGRTLSLDAAGSRAPLTTDGGAHTVSANLDVPIGITKTGPGKLTLSGNAAGLSVSGWGYLGAAGTAVLVSDAGSELVIGGVTPLVSQMGTTVTGGGKLTVTGTYTTADHDQIIGDAGTAGTLELSGSGTWTHTGTGFFQIANNNPGCVGTLIVKDNAVLDTQAPIAIGVGWGGGCVGIVNQTGGRVSDRNPDGTSFGWGVGDGSSGTYNLNGGVLETAQLVGDGAGVNVLNFNGGTVRPLSDTWSTNFITTLTHAYVQDNGAIIDNNGFSVALDQALEHGTGAAIDGGLTKKGLGTLTLLRASTYTGPTRVRKIHLRQRASE